MSILIIKYHFILTNYQLKYLLSIDSMKMEVINIFLSYISKKREVVAFLDELHKLLCSDDFDINTNLNFIRKKQTWR